MEKKEVKKKGNPLVLIIAVVVIGLVAFAASQLGLVEKLSDVKGMQAFINGFGIWGYLVFILIYIASCVFMIPGSMLTIVAGIVFGPILGGLIALIGATFGATAAFLVAKYLARGLIEEKIGKNAMFKKIDDGVEQNGMSFLILTRLVPV